MNKRAKQFGTLAPMPIDSKQRLNAMERHVEELKNPRKDTFSEQIAAWSSYVVLVLTTIGAFMPQTAAAAINGVKHLIC